MSKENNALTDQVIDIKDIKIKGCEKMKKIIIVCSIIIFQLLSGCVSTPTERSNMPFNVSIISYPTNVKGDTNFTVSWLVSGEEGNITHTAVHWGLSKGGLDVQDYGNFGKVYTGKIPQEFSTELISPTSGTIYFRAHAIVNGTDVYSSEYTIKINQ